MAIRYYCGKCHDMVHLTPVGRCTKCGGMQIYKSKQITDQEWNAKSGDEKTAFIEATDNFSDPNEAKQASYAAEAEASGDEGGDWQNHVTTTPSFEGKTIQRYVGPVSAAEIYLAGGLTGSGLINQDKLFEKAFVTAKGRLLRKAFEHGGNAVVGMQTTALTGGLNLAQIIVVVTGTAVFVLDE